MVTTTIPLTRETVERIKGKNRDPKNPYFMEDTPTLDILLDDCNIGDPVLDHLELLGFQIRDVKAINQEFLKICNRLSRKSRGESNAMYDFLFAENPDALGEINADEKVTIQKLNSIYLFQKNLLWQGLVQGDAYKKYTHFQVNPQFDENGPGINLIPNFTKDEFFPFYQEAQINNDFDLNFDSMQSMVSRRKLLRASRIENPELCQDVKEDRLSLKEILRKQYLQIMLNEDNLPSEALKSYLETTCDKSASVLTILANHKLVAPFLISRNLRGGDTLAYHPIGRKGKLYGEVGPIWYGQPYKKQAITINTTPFQSTDIDIDSYIIDVLDHEILGHRVMDLNDHPDKPTESCIMATARCDADYMGVTQTQKGLYLCEICAKRAA